MTLYTISDLHRDAATVVSLEEAAIIASLDPHEIVWAIEEYGLCETDQYMITECDEIDEQPAQQEGKIR